MKRGLPGTTVILAFLATTASPAWAADACMESGTPIDWSVEGRFRLFAGQEASQHGDELLDAIAKAGSVYRAYDSVINKLTQAVEVGPKGSPSRRLYQMTHYDRPHERYGRGDGSTHEADRREFLTPSNHTIKATLRGAAGNTCSWSVAGIQQAETRCANARLRVPKNWSDLHATTAITVRAGALAGTICVNVRDTLIVSFGDSFSSGEGNPDLPTDWTKLSLGRHGQQLQTGPVNNPTGTKEKAHVLWWLRPAAGVNGFLPADASAEWWDTACHRSLLSQHALAALGYAATKPHETVTYLSYACSGASVLDGLTAPRTDAPGAHRFQGMRSRALVQSQINQAVATLCRSSPSDGDYDLMSIPAGGIYWNEPSQKTPPEAVGQLANQVAIRRCGSWLRRPDIVLNSMGGNDIGFAGGVAWMLVPPASRGVFRPLDPVVFVSQIARVVSSNPGLGMVCPIAITGQERCNALLSSDPAPTMFDLMHNDLPNLLAMADDAFQVAGLTSEKRVLKIHSGYPLPTRDQDNGLCGAWANDKGQEVVGDLRAYPVNNLYRQVEPWMAIYSQVRKKLGALEGSGLWSFGMSNLKKHSSCPFLENAREVANTDLKETCVFETHIVRPLNEKVRSLERSGWRVLNGEELPQTHGLCAHSKGAMTYEREFGWPRWSGKYWNDEYPTPQDWQPYAKRPRWFRTANDAALTGFVAGFQDRGINESLSGTVHPTAEMHAHLADKLVTMMSAAP